MNEEIKNECLERMNILKLSHATKQAFSRKNNPEVWKSIRGILYDLDKNEKELVKNFEEEYDVKVCHVIPGSYEFGTYYSYLYVNGNEKETWEEDKEDLKSGYAFVYVENINEPVFSEFGTIGVKPAFGGLIRTV